MSREVSAISMLVGVNFGGNYVFNSSLFFMYLAGKVGNHLEMILKSENNEERDEIFCTSLLSIRT